MSRSNMTDERAARRFHQMAVLEIQVSLKDAEIASAELHLRSLRRAQDGLIERLRAAARDEGELPLFDLDGE
jgi:hypothetical protein